MTKDNKRGPYGQQAKAGYKEPVKLSLDPGTIDILKNYGSGNLSAGVRMAAAFIDTWQKGESK